MYTNIDKKHLTALCEKEPEAKLIIDTMLENHKRIIGTIGHEIGNPLTYLYSSIQLLEDTHEILNEDKHWLAFKDELLYMKDLLHQLSSYNNGSNLRIEEVDLYELVSSTVLSFASSCVDDDIEVTSTISPLPTALVDKNKIKQAIINILKNSKEACSANGKIDITAHESDGFITMVVIDNGCGIPAEILADPSKPFKTTKANGTGLGLSIIHEIITAHDGVMKIFPMLDGGTLFVFSIPLK